MNRTLSTLCASLALAAAACGGSQQTQVVEDTGPEIIELDIPGVAPAALSAYYDGVRAMNETPTNYTAALSAFTRAAELDPDFWEALENVGLLQMDLGRYREAVETFRRQITLIDELVGRGWPVQARPEVQLSLGKALALSGDTQGAAQAFNAMLEADPQNVEARANLAALMFRARNYDNAREYIDELLEMSRNDPGALSVLALIAKEEGDMQLATYLWQRTLVEIDTTVSALSDETQYEGLSEDESGRLQRYNTNRVNRLNKVLSDVQNELGILRAGEGDSDAAELLFRLAVRNNASNAAAHTNLATIYLDFANFDQSCTHFQEALALRPRDLQGLVGFASCTYGLGDVDAAYTAFQNAAREHADSPYVAQRIGDIAFQDLNDQDAALEWYGRNLQMRSMNPATCQPTADAVCASYQSIIQIREMQRQMQQQGAGQ